MLGTGELVGDELVRPVGESRWRPLHDLPVFAEILGIPADDAARVAGERRDGRVRVALFAVAIAALMPIVATLPWVYPSLPATVRALALPAATLFGALTMLLASGVSRRTVGGMYSMLVGVLLVGPLIGFAMVCSGSLVGVVEPAEIDAPETESTDAYPYVDDVLSLTDAPYTGELRYVLIAGSSDAANFAQEVVNQRKHWRSQGVPANQIACYVALPRQHAFEDDINQWRVLARHLEDCRPAHVARIRDDLRGHGPKDGTLFLYVTGHGDAPSDHADRLPEDAPQRQFRITVDGMADGPAHLYEQYGAYRAGVPFEDLFLTPDTMRGWFDALPPELSAVIVLQACHAGGFIEDGNGLTDLAGRSGTTILAASAHDRSSFGCQSGNYVTEYGQAFADALQEHPGLPGDIDWIGLHGVVELAVEAAEADYAEYDTGGDFEPSEPMISYAKSAPSE